MPRSTARFARRPAPTMTDGLEVLVHDVIAAITTAPSVRWKLSPDRDTWCAGGARVASVPLPPSASHRPEFTGGVLGGEPFMDPSASEKLPFTAARESRSCGRLRPATLRSTLPRSTESESE